MSCLRICALLDERERNPPVAAIEARAERVVEHVRHHHFIGQVQLTVGVVRVSIEPDVAAPHVGSGGVGEPHRVGLKVQSEVTGSATAGRTDGERVKVRRVVANRHSRSAGDEGIERAVAGGPGAEESELRADAQILKAF